MNITTAHKLWLTAQIFLLSSIVFAGQSPRQMHVYRGTTPVVDGVISPDEYKDATAFGGPGQLMSRFNPTTDPNDLCLWGWVKHDGKDLYFAFKVTDNLIYGIDTDLWLPKENPKAHDLTTEGYPWFGDGVEILINPLYRWFEQGDDQILKDAGIPLFGTKFNAGNGTSWQMACSTTKSYLGGLGKPGLMPAENRDNPVAWPNYIRWIEKGDMEAAVRMINKGYIIEWKIKADPCLEVAPGIFWKPELGTVKMGLNIAVQDLDRMEDGEGNFGNFNHEDWWAGEKDIPYFLNQWGTMVLHPGERACSAVGK